MQAAAQYRHPCPLCGSTEGKSTSDHEPPQWFYTTIKDFNQRMALAGKVVSENGQFRLRAKVCWPCHEWLNTTYEIRADKLIRPMFDGIACQLDREQTRFLAEWIAKTAIVGGQSRQNEPQHRIPAKFARALRAGYGMPFASIFVGHVDPSGKGLGMRQMQPQPDVLGPNVIRFASNWGRMFIVWVLMVAWPEDVECGTLFQNPTLNFAQYKGVLRRIHPHLPGEPGLTWPLRPMTTMTMRSIQWSLRPGARDDLA